MRKLKVFTPVLLLLALAAPAPLSADEEAARRFLEDLSAEAFARLTDPALSQAEKQANFQDLLRSTFDLPAIGRFVLGKHWRRADADQRRRFVTAFEELQMRRFLPIFGEYSDEQVSITRAQQDAKKPDFYFVGTEVARVDAEDISLVWRIRDKKGRFKVLDIVAEGVSMAISLRHEYSTVIQSRGVDGLIALINEKNEQLAAEQGGDS